MSGSINLKQIKLKNLVKIAKSILFYLVLLIILYSGLVDKTWLSAYEQPRLFLSYAITAVIGLLFLLTLTEKKFLKSFNLKICILFLLFVSITMFFNKYPLADYIKICFTILCITAFSYIHINSKKRYALIAVLSILLIKYMYTSINLYDTFMSSYDIRPYIINPNLVGFLMLSIVLSLSKLIENRKIINALVVVAIPFMLHLHSRGALLALLVFAVLMNVSYSRYGKKITLFIKNKLKIQSSRSIKKTLYIACIGIVLIMPMLYVSLSYGQSAKNPDSIKIGKKYLFSGRDTIWKGLFSKIDTRTLASGLTYEEKKQVTDHSLNKVYSMHNIYLEVFTFSGAVGLLLFLVFLFSFFMFTKKSVIYFIPIMLISTTEAVFVTMPLLTIIVCVIFMRMNTITKTSIHAKK